MKEEEARARFDRGGDNIRRFLLTSRLLLAATGAISPAAAGQIYWADETTGTIQRADLDGSGVEDVLAGLPAPTGVALFLPTGEPVPALSIGRTLVAALLLLALGTYAICRRS